MDTIASAALPPRVRGILHAFFGEATAHMFGRMESMLTELEQQLFRQAERARSNEQQSEQLANLHALRQQRSDLLPHFLARLEAEVAAIRRPRAAGGSDAEPLEYRTLSLVADAEIDQEIVLRDIARRREARGHVALYLLGQRFGVLAGSPAWEPAHLPLGPQSLCRALRHSASALQMDLASRLLLYRVFDLKVLADYEAWLELLNHSLAAQGVLPALVFAPQRARMERAAPRTPPTAPADIAGIRPLTGWQGMPGAVEAAPAAPEQEPVRIRSSDDGLSFAALQQLLQGRRGSDGRHDAAHATTSSTSTSTSAAAPAATAPAPLPTSDVLSSLRVLQAVPVMVQPGQPRRSMRDVQELLLTQVRRKHGPQAALVQQDADTFELLDVLYNEIEREVKRDAPAVELLVRLQVPVAQAALNNRDFFEQTRHPARELLNSVAESGASWLGEDEIDPQLLHKLQQAVARVVSEYNGDDAVFHDVNREVQGHFTAMARRAEVSERRHVDAARGRDRLEVAKQQAADTLAAALQGHAPQKFVQALLNQAWADVLTLALLRHGQDSQAWRETGALTERIVAATGGIDAAPDPTLAPKLESALAQVGYHADEAAAIARRLSGVNDEEGGSRTELTARLKARTRLGENSASKKPRHSPRPPRVQEYYEHLRTLPFGTWFEFVLNQQGDVSRQRLSWFSPVSDNALFVNQRGQKVAEHSLDSVARMMAIDQARIVPEDKGRLIDRAWRATVNTLRSLSGGKAT